MWVLNGVPADKKARSVDIGVLCAQASMHVAKSFAKLTQQPSRLRAYASFTVYLYMGEYSVCVMQQLF
jgi:hypothetical protein